MIKVTKIIKFNQYKRYRDKCVSIRRKTIKDYLLSKCKPGASSKQSFDVLGPFINNKCRSQRNILLKEDDQIITDTTELCEIFSTFFSSCANYIGQPDEIDLSELDFLTNIIDRHNNYKSILKSTIKMYKVLILSL